MRLRAVGLAAGLGVAVAVALLWRGPGASDHAPLDRPVTLAMDGPLRITVFGTSLSADRYDWPQRLEAVLSACLARDVAVQTVAAPGATVRWAQTRVRHVLETAPDLVLMEFAINDADITDGVGRGRAADLTARVVADLSAGAPAVALMTMSPASGLRGVLRPRLGGHYADYGQIAATQDVGLIDLETRWRALPRALRGLEDGLHPDPAIAAEVIVPAIAGWMGCAVQGA